MTLASLTPAPVGKIVHTTWSPAVSNMNVQDAWAYWVCECGTDGVDVVESSGACPGCHRRIRIAEPETVGTP